MSVLSEIHREGVFRDPRDYEDTVRKVADALREGTVERVVPQNLKPAYGANEFFRDKRSGEVYRLVSPDPPAGWWGEVTNDDWRKLLDT
jgi:hypothetical protein